MGFGQANTSVLSQLAAAGDAKRVFSHCLDNVKGGGIFAIGVVDSPAVKTTPMVPNQYVMPSQAFFFCSFHAISLEQENVHKSISFRLNSFFLIYATIPYLSGMSR